MLVLASPSERPSEQDVKALRAFLEKGGRVLATGPAAAAAFLPGVPARNPRRPRAPADPRLARARRQDRALPGAITDAVESIEMAASTSPLAADSPYVVVYGSEQAPAVLTRERGEGPSHVVGELGAAGQRGDRASEARRAAREYARSARRADDTLGRVLSRSHALVLVVHRRHAVLRGHHAGPRDRRRSRSSPTPGVVGRSARRVVEPRTSPLEFIDTMGGLYERARASDGGRRDGARARPSPARWPRSACRWRPTTSGWSRLLPSGWPSIAPSSR